MSQRDSVVRALPAIVKTVALESVEVTTISAVVPKFLRWFEFVRERAANTITAYRVDLVALAAFLEGMGVKEPDQVTVQMLEAYQAWLRQGGRKPSTVNRAIHAASTFFKWLHREKMVTHNPASDVAPLKAGRRLPKYLTVPEQERLLEILIRDHSPEGQRDLVLIGTALLCGLRVEELCSLRMDQVNLEQGVLRVIGKGDKERELVIVPRLAGWLRAYFSDGRPALLRKCAPAARDVAWVLVAQHGARGRQGRMMEPLKTRSVHSLIKYVLGPMIGRKDLHPHALRHSFASRLRENGAPLELISEAMGHASVQTTMVYSHISSAKQRADVAKYLA